MTHRRAIVVLVLACLALYGQSVGFGYVRADDTDLIESNAAFLSSLLNIPAAFGRSFFESGSVLTAIKTYYRPLTIASFIVETAIFGSNPAVYHATNVVLHALVVVALYVLLTRAARVAQGFNPAGAGSPKGLRYERGAFVAALLFAAHPANVQTVSWIMGRNELLLAVFGLVAFGTFAARTGAKAPDHDNQRPADRQRSADRQRLAGVIQSSAVVVRSFSFGVTAIHVAAFAGAVFSKETGVVLLPLLALWMVLTGGSRTRARMLALDLAVVCLWWGLRAMALTGGAAVGGFSWQTIAANVPQLFSYFEKVVFPFRLNTMPGVDRWSIVLGSVSAIAVASLLVHARGWRLAGFAAAWFVAFLAPALLVPDLPAYEHRLYLPLIGLALAFGTARLKPGTTREGDPSQRDQKAANPRIPNPESRIPTAAFAISVALVIVSFRYGDTFRTPLTFWTRATASPQFAPIAHVNVGQLLQDEGKPEEAASHFRQALAIDPNTPKANNNLGVALMQLDQPREALEAFTREVTLHPSNADGQFNLGLYLKLAGRPDEAARYWQEAIRVNRYYAPAYEELIAYFSEKGDAQKAEEYENALRALRRQP